MDKRLAVLLALALVAAAYAAYGPLSIVQPVTVAVTGYDADQGPGGEWRAVPLCRLGDEYRGGQVFTRVVLVAEDRYEPDNWALYEGYMTYNHAAGGKVYTVTRKIADLPFRDGNVYTPPWRARPGALFWLVVHDGVVVEPVHAEIGCTPRPGDYYGDHVMAHVAEYEYEAPGPQEPGNATATPGQEPPASGGAPGAQEPTGSPGVAPLALAAAAVVALLVVAARAA